MAACLGCAKVKAARTIVSSIPSAQVPHYTAPLLLDSELSSRICPSRIVIIACLGLRKTQSCRPLLLLL